MDQIYGIWWSGHDDDLKLVGEKGKGYKAISWSVPGDYPVLADIKKYVVDAGKSKISGPERMNKVFYQRGVLISMMLAEGIKVAQAKFGTANINSVQLQYGLENLNIDDARLAELGMSGMIAPFATSCSDHTGHGGAWIIEWDGKSFSRVSDHLMPDRAEIKPLEDALAKEYAKSNAPWPTRTCN